MPDTTSATSLSGRRRRGPSKGDRKEAALLDSGWRLLAEKPLVAITIDEIAAGAGISRSSFYFYFDSREALIRTLADRTTVEIEQAALGPMQSGGPPRQVIEKSVTNLLARWRESGPLIRAMDILSEHDAELRDFWRAVAQSIVTEWAAAIDRERDAGRALPGPPTALDLAWALTHMYWRAGQQASLEPASIVDDQRLVETLTAVTVRSIYGT